VKNHAVRIWLDFFGINRPCPCDAATLATADMNGDGRVTSLDALMILQVAAS